MKITTVWLVATLAFALNASAENNSSNWLSIENRPDCKYFKFPSENPRLSHWTGRCADGYVQGQGTITFTTDLGDGKIVGVFNNGDLDGYGEINSWMLHDGIPYRSEYKGFYRGGMLSGYGTAIVGDIFHYSGHFKNAEPHGYGEMESNGTSYFGNYKNGLYDGMGIYRGRDIYTFTGTFRNGMADGAGDMEFNGTGGTFRITGAFKGLIEDPLNALDVIGYGVLQHDYNGLKYRYTGEFKGIEMHGYGIQVFDSGMRYEGMFENDRRNGHGITISHNGDTCEGEWQTGRMVKIGMGLHDGRAFTCTVDETLSITYVSGL